MLIVACGQFALLGACQTQHAVGTALAACMEKSFLAVIAVMCMFCSMVTDVCTRRDTSMVTVTPEGREVYASVGATVVWHRGTLSAFTSAKTWRHSMTVFQQHCYSTA